MKVTILPPGFAQGYEPLSSCRGPLLELEEDTKGVAGAKAAMVAFIRDRREAHFNSAGKFLLEARILAATKN